MLVALSLKEQVTETQKHLQVLDGPEGKTADEWAKIEKKVTGLPGVKFFQLVGTLAALEVSSDKDYATLRAALPNHWQSEIVGASPKLPNEQAVQFSPIKCFPEPEILSITLVKAVDGVNKTKAERVSLAEEIAEEWKEIAPTLTKVPGVHVIYPNHYSVSLEVHDREAFLKALPKNWVAKTGAPPLP